MRRNSKANGSPALRSGASGAALAVAARRFSRLLADQSKRYVRAVHAARREPTQDATHAVRVSTRRLRALLDVLGALGPADRTAQMLRDLDGPFRGCGKLRDFLVMRMYLRTLVSQFPEVRAVIVDLKLEEKKARLKAARALAAAHPRRLVRSIGDLAREVDARAPALAPGTAGARQLALTILRAARDAESARLLSLGGDPEAIHHARIALKSLRYLLEFAHPLRHPTAALELERLRRMQNLIGGIADRSMMLDVLRRYGQRHRRRADRLAPLSASINRQRALLIQRYCEAAANSSWHRPALRRSEARRADASATPRRAARSARSGH